MMARLRRTGEWLMQVRVFSTMLVFGLGTMPIAAWIGVGRRSYYVGDTLVLLGILAYLIGAFAGVSRLQRWIKERGLAIFLRQPPFTKLFIVVAVLLFIAVVFTMKYQQYFGANNHWPHH